MQDLLKIITIDLAHLAETGGAIVIAYATIRALVVFALNAVRTPSSSVPAESIRLNLGRGLALALEFLLGADILTTAIAPTWADIEMLAAIAAIRTALNYFLARELREAADNQKALLTQKALEQPRLFQERERQAELRARRPASENDERAS